MDEIRSLEEFSAGERVYLIGKRFLDFGTVLAVTADEVEVLLDRDEASVTITADDLAPGKDLTWGKPLPLDTTRVGSVVSRSLAIGGRMIAEVVGYTPGSEMSLLYEGMDTPSVYTAGPVSLEQKLMYWALEER